MEKVIGMGQFGVVLEVSAIHEHAVVDPPCEISCTGNTPQTPKSSLERIYPLKVVGALQGMAEKQSVSDSSDTDHDFKKLSFKSLSESETTVSTVPSLISTTDNYFDDEDDDRDEQFALERRNSKELSISELRSNMCRHPFRGRDARYAVKQLRKDLYPKKKFEAAIDLAREAKFLVSLEHPNIAKLRAIVSSPGRPDFMIVLDRFRVTLHDKISLQWKHHISSQNSGVGLVAGLLTLSRSRMDLQSNVLKEQLSALYDISQAMRYLHKHM